MVAHSEAALSSPDMAFEVGGELELAIDRELEAAIEYKIASCGLAGVERIFDFVNCALRRRIGEAERVG
ncbi:hypothetical protein L1787_15105 [Acuticoccus sp. M5D2P5]|uniref:hypothetical protein n=1 Tax=Acuticoccus kalidii TaxID=2910977 RepID=UPI001F4774B4|nr:hypothetical protein [Acuticoccus kalidii]MCF3934729.1 hypothetical protein [Acuticoccus kalidii]